MFFDTRDRQKKTWLGTYLLVYYPHPHADFGGDEKPKGEGPLEIEIFFVEGG